MNTATHVVCTACTDQQHGQMLMVLWLAALAVCALVLLLRARRQRRVTGFFHPYCNDGGGGERVLW